nr:molecular chaperone TorD family protein [Pyrobaculum arsenaticum]
MALFLILRGDVEPRKLGLDVGAINCDVSEIGASLLREDLDPVTRSLLPKAIAQFYENYGYEVAGEPDSLLAMTAFMAQLAKTPTEESLKAQLRFLNTHLLPTLRYALQKCPDLRPIYEILVEDAEVVKTTLVKDVRG